MSATRSLYGRASSYNVQKVLWFLDELGLSYDHIQCGGKWGGLNTPEFIELNPFQKVPVLVDNGHNIWQSNSILRYLAASYGQNEWWSLSSVERSLHDRWMDWSIEKLEVSFVGVFWEYYRMPEHKQDWNQINKHLHDYRVCLDALDRVLQQHNFIAGNSITLADIANGVFIFRLQDIGLEVTLPPSVERWYRRLSARPGFSRWVMSDFSELKGREDY